MREQQDKPAGDDRPTPLGMKTISINDYRPDPGTIRRALYGPSGQPDPKDFPAKKT